MKKFCWVFAVAAFFCAAVVPVSCWKSADAQKAPSPPPQVLVTPVIQRDVPLVHEWVGTLDGSLNVTIQSRVTGYLIAQDYVEGSLVHANQLLFEIDPSTFKAALAEYQANLAKSQATEKKTAIDAARYEKLFAQKAVSQEDRDTAVQNDAAAKADVLAQQAAVEQAQLNLEFTKITAPVSGIAGIANAQIGDLVSTSGPTVTTLTTLSTVDPIKVYFSLSEQEYLEAAPLLEQMGKLPEARRPAIFEMILSNGQTFPGKGRFDFADRAINPQTGTIRLTALFPNPGNVLRPGQYARVRVAFITQKGALLVPQEAVNELQGADQVTVVGPDNTAHLRSVTVGAREGIYWIIAQGLRPGERVVVQGLQAAHNGMTVAPKPWTPTAELKQAAARPTAEFGAESQPVSRATSPSQLAGN